jgi:EAL domain-containing protein (putative c-di-GMP-specific phosphodiesterase class I)
MEQQARKNLQIETELRKAIAQHDLKLFYQPQVDINTGGIIGAESLLRWQHDELGFVSPADFIPVAEKSGLIIAIGDLVLESACEQIKRWEISGLFEQLQSISVNISSLHFVYPDFIDTLERILKETQINPNHLDIELTETALINDHKTVEQRLNQIKALGCRISIDDFGTGYSSLQYLSSFPLDVLKVDKCFVDDIATKTANRAITNAIIALAKMLNAEVIAEGVENSEQLYLLKGAGCNTYQGYYFSPAVPPVAFQQLVHEQSKEAIPG